MNDDKPIPVKQEHVVTVHYLTTKRCFKSLSLKTRSKIYRWDSSLDPNDPLWPFDPNDLNDSNDSNDYSDCNLQ